MAEPVGNRHGPGTAISLAGGVVGVGALFLPWLVAAGHGTVSVVAWVFHLVAGALLVTALGAAGAAPAHDGSLTLARRAVPRYYLLGVTVGQAVVAAVAGGFLATAVGAPGSWVLFALAVLVPAGVVGATGWRGPPWTGRVMFAAIALVSVLALTGGGSATGPNSVTGVGDAAFVMLFAFVGWEGAARLSGVRTSWLLGGVGLVGLVYVGLAVFAAENADGSASALPFTLAPFGHDALGRGAAALAGLLCAVACARNLALVVTLGRQEFPRLRSPLWTAGPAVVVAASGTLLLHARVLRLEDLLSVPNAMALAVFLTAAAGVVLQGRSGARPAADARPAPVARLAAGAALIAYALLIPFAGLALVWPAAILLITASTRYPRRKSGAPDQLRRL